MRIVYLLTSLVCILGHGRPKETYSTLGQYLDKRILDEEIAKKAGTWAINEDIQWKNKCSQNKLAPQDCYLTFINAYISESYPVTVPGLAQLMVNCGNLANKFKGKTLKEATAAAAFLYECTAITLESTTAALPIEKTFIDDHFSNNKVMLENPKKDSDSFLGSFLPKIKEMLVKGESTEFLKKFNKDPEQKKYFRMAYARLKSSYETLDAKKP